MPIEEYWDEEWQEPWEDLPDRCERCGGDGMIEYLAAGPSVWGEDCPSEPNHLVICPECGGQGTIPREDDDG